MNKNQWVYHNPVFECDQYNPELLLYSPWVGHRNFAYDYVCFEKPAVIVELGSYYGCSSFSFLQAIKDQSLDTSFFAVDTWCGDDFTKTDYQENIYEAYKRINDQCFSGIRSFMLRKTFDEACESFADGSINLLHIDGSHKYEDVKNDYYRWRSRLASDGVVFFHDVGMDLLFGKPMGSHIFWEELKSENPYTLEFPFSNGLGILFSTEEAYLRMKQQVDFGIYQNALNLQDTVNKDIIRKNYFSIRDLSTHNADLKQQISILNHHLDRYKEDSAATAAYVGQMEQQCADYRQAMTDKDSRIAMLEQQLESLGSFAKEKENYAGDLETQMAQLSTYADGKAAYVAELERNIAEVNRFAEDKERYVQELEGKLAEAEKWAAQQISELNEFAEGKDRYARQLQKQMTELNRFADEKAAYAVELEQQLLAANRLAEGKDRDIRELQGIIDRKEKQAAQQLAELNQFAEGKDRYARELEGQLTTLREFAEGKESYIQELEEQMTQLNAFASGKDKYAAQLEEQLAELNRYAEGKADYAAKLEQERETLCAFAQEKEQEITRLQNKMEELRIFADKKADRVAVLEETITLRDEQICRLTADCSRVSEEYNQLDNTLKNLSQRVCKLPFGRKLLRELEISQKREGANANDE